MDRVNGANWVDIGGGKRGFRAQNALAGEPGTEVTDAFLNNIQEEIAKVIEAAGLVLDPNDWTQLYQALLLMGLNGFGLRHPWRPVISVSTINPPGAPVVGDSYIVPAGATGVWADKSGTLAEWIGGTWAFLNAPNGHGVSLPDGSVFMKIANAYVQFDATEARKALVQLASVQEAYDALNTTKAVTPAGLAGYMRRQTSDKVLYVRSDGNDANDGALNTAARAMKTIQAAIDRANGLYSGSGFMVSISVGAGTFGSATASYSGAMRFRIVGAGVASTIIDGAGGAGCITSLRSNIIVDSVRLQNADSLLRAIGGEIRFSNVAFGVTTSNHIYSIEGGTIVSTGNYSILASTAYHAVAGQNSYVYLSGVTVSAAGGNYTGAFYYCNGGSISAAGNTYGFTATGVKYQVNIGGILWTNNNLSGVPGNGTPVVGSGGEAY